MYARLGDDLLVGKIRIAFYFNARNIIFLGMVVIHFDPLRPDKGRRKQQSQKGQDPSYSHFHSINVQIYPII